MIEELQKHMSLVKITRKMKQLDEINIFENF